MNSTYEATADRLARAVDGPRGVRRLRAAVRAWIGGDVRDTWQIAAGAVLFPLGIGVVLLAWYGAAHTPYVQQQIPYLVSGSFIGLGFMIVGGLLYFAHWLYRIYDQADLQHQERMHREEGLLRELIDAVAELRGATPAGIGVAVAGSPAAPPVTASQAPARVVFVATATGSNFHLPTCPIVTGRKRGLRTLTPDALAALTPCRICDPLGA